MWSQLVLDRFRSFLVLVSTERLNVGIDLIWWAHFCVKIFFILGFVQNFNHFHSQPLETIERRSLYIYRRLYSHLYGPMSQVLHPTCRKISNFWNVGRVKSHIQAARYQIVPHSRRSIYFFSLYKNPPVCHTCFWYLQIFSRVFPWLNFECWIICQLSSFKCKSATAYILQNFPNVLADWYFSWLYLNFHWLSSCELFSGVFFSLA